MNPWFLRFALATAVLGSVEGCGGGGSTSTSTGATALIAISSSEGMDALKKMPIVVEERVDMEKAFPGTTDKCVAVLTEPYWHPGISFVPEITSYTLYQLPLEQLDSAKKLGFTESIIGAGGIVSVGITTKPSVFVDCPK